MQPARHQRRSILDSGACNDAPLHPHAAPPPSPLLQLAVCGYVLASLPRFYCLLLVLKLICDIRLFHLVPAQNLALMQMPWAEGGDTLLRAVECGVVRLLNVHHWSRAGYHYLYYYLGP